MSWTAVYPAVYPAVGCLCYTARGRISDFRNGILVDMLCSEVEYLMFEIAYW